MESDQEVDREGALCGPSKRPGGAGGEAELDHEVRVRLGKRKRNDVKAILKRQRDAHDLRLLRGGEKNGLTPEEGMYVNRWGRRDEARFAGGLAGHRKLAGFLPINPSDRR